VATWRRIFDRYGAAGGGLLAGGLAYSALFAIVPAVLLSTGVVGLVVRDAAERSKVIDTIVGVLPPLRDLISAVLEEAARSAAPVSIIGAVTLVWGASRFAVAFQDSIARVMGGERRRGLVGSNIVALGAVLLAIGVLVASTVLSGLLEFLEAAARQGVLPFLGDAVALSLGLVPVVATVLAMILVYRLVPAARPPWRAVIVPGVAIGLVLTIIARIFAFLAPRLIGAAALVGTLATAFAALAWLGLSFQAVLIGAAWVRDRAERTRPAGAAEIEV
jgi:membrane protein